MWLTDIFKIKKFKSMILTLQRENATLSSKVSSLEGENYFSIQGKVGELNNCYDQRLQESQTLSLQIRERFEKVQELDKQIISKQRKLTRIKEIYHGIEASIQSYRTLPPEYENHELDEKFMEECEKHAPAFLLSVPSMNDKELHEAYLTKEKIITDLFRQYTNEFSDAYDKAIYELVVLYVRAEIQNILYGIKCNSAESASDAVKGLCKRCLRIAYNGNLHSTESFTKFIGEVEYHLNDLIQIEIQYCNKNCVS
ncbi:MAG: hypothetical protein IJC02_06215 [Lachnospiraceae bacterium]|nr:hypothetical protein [Lachnospiraceae bacterium]MBQ3545474.1 hypothetical protein [Lachnospiraceae bacterium]